MRLVYTLIVSGIILFNEVPVDQRPPPNSHQDALDAKNVAVVQEVSLTTSLFPAQNNLDIVAATLLTINSPTLSDVQPKATLTAPPDLKVTATAMPKYGSAADVLATYAQASSLPITGYAMYYNPNVMQAVLDYRLELGQVTICAECVGNVALLRAGDLNRRVWLQWEDGTVEGPFLVVDAAAQHHISQLLARNWAVDVDNRTAVRHGMAGPVPVTVWDAPPAGQVEMPPFSPLYGAAPIATAPPTPAATGTEIPAMVVATGTGAIPALAILPTVTPLPAINDVNHAELAPTLTPVPAASPAPSVNMPALNTPASNPSVLDAVISPTAMARQQGFPPDTPIPTVTPLPFIPAASAAVTLPLVVSPTVQPAAPTFVPTPSPTASPAADAVVTQRGFPPDTPVPTVTPLPAISPLPSHTPAIPVN